MSTTSLTSLVPGHFFTSGERHGKLQPIALIAKLIASLGTFSFGYASGYASPVAKQLQKYLSLSDEASSWFDVSTNHRCCDIL